MRDLYRCLGEYPIPLLRAIAHSWGVSLTSETSQAMAVELGDAILAHRDISQILATLSSAAQEALAQVARRSGIVPGYHLALNYGQIRRLGPVRMAREQPWLAPANPLEELFYRGLLYRAYGQVGDHYGELFVIPQQLLERLPSLPDRNAVFGNEMPMPPRIVRQETLFVEDILAILVHLRRQPLPIPTEQHASVAIMSIHLGQRLIGASIAPRMALLWRLMQRLELLQEQNGILSPGLRAREWLRLDDITRQGRILAVWRDDPEAYELAQLPTLVWQGSEPTYDAPQMRRQFLEALSAWPPERWFPLDALVRHLKRYHPDYLRPDGDYTSWYVRDRKTGEQLSGLESWDHIEGALALHMLSKPLHWLGIVALGYEKTGHAPTAFCVCESGIQALGAIDRSANESTPHRRMPCATVGQELTVRISLTNTAYERYQLERFAEWLGQESDPHAPEDARVARYRITDRSLRTSQEAGIKIEQIVGFLKRITGEQVPSDATLQLLAWAARQERVSLRRVILLQTNDRQTMEQLCADTELAALLGERLSPTTCLVRESDFDALRKCLEALGISARIER